MTLLGISWLWWAIGSFGIVGTALMLWLAPAVLVQIVKAALTFFFTTRIGNIIAAAAIAFFIGDVNRSIYDEHEYAAKTAQFEQAQKARDAEIADQTREEVWKGIADATAANIQIDQDVKEITDATPHDVNGVNPRRIGDNVCRLRALAGQPGCGPESGQGVPKAGTAAADRRDHKGHRFSRFVRRVLGRDQKGSNGHKGP